MSRHVGWMVLAQFVAVVVGFLALGVVLKVNGYPANGLGVRWNGIAVRLREYGPWLLIAPVVWGIYALACEHYNQGLLSEGIAGTAGALLLVLVLAFFLYAACVPFTRPMLISSGPHSQPTTNK